MDYTSITKIIWFISLLTSSFDEKRTSQYLDIQYYYSSDDVGEMNEFLYLPYDISNVPKNAMNSKRMYVKHPLKIGLFSNL